MIRLGTRFLSLFGILALSSSAFALTAAYSGASAVNGNIIYYSNISTTIQNIAGTKYYVDNTGGACSSQLNANCRTSASQLAMAFTASSAPANSSARMYLMVAATAPVIGTSLTSNIGGAPALTYVANSPVGFQPTFGAICSALATSAPVGGLGSNCEDTNKATAPGLRTASLYVIADTDASGTYTSGDEILTVTLNFISSIPTSAVTGTGPFLFTSFPGDSKIYIRNPQLSLGFPLDVNGNVGTSTVRFYFSSVQSTTCNISNYTALGPTTGGTTADKTVDTAGNLSDYMITGLTNGVEYYFRAAVIDAAGNIGYLTDNDQSGGFTCTSRSSIPDAVYGLLKNKNNCFIATAAFDSPQAKQVQVLREFRDKILLKSSAGKAFVAWYYRHSPPWADRIRPHDDVRALVRLGLYPLIGYGELAMRIGAFNASLAFATLLMLPLLFVVWHRSFKKSRLLR